MRNLRSVLSSLAVLVTLALGSAACTTPPRPVVANQAHPAHVVAITGTDAASVRAQLAEHRKQQIERLEAYSQEGIFPRNTTSPGPIHMFKDPDGRRCAVANLVHLDGHDDVVDDYATRQNDVVVADVTSGPLADWILTSGLTREEIAAIQAPAPYVMQDAPEDQLRSQMQGYFGSVEQQLIDGTDKSLDVAVARYEASAGNVAAR